MAAIGLFEASETQSFYKLRDKSLGVRSRDKNLLYSLMFIPWVSLVLFPVNIGWPTFDVSTMDVS